MLICWLLVETLNVIWYLAAAIEAQPCSFGGWREGVCWVIGSVDPVNSFKDIMSGISPSLETHLRTWKLFLGLIWLCQNLLHFVIWILNQSLITLISWWAVNNDNLTELKNWWTWWWERGLANMSNFRLKSACLVTWASLATAFLIAWNLNHFFEVCIHWQKLPWVQWWLLEAYLCKRLPLIRTYSLHTIFEEIFRLCLFIKLFE